MAKQSQNLTEIAFWTRKIIKISFFVILALTIGKAILIASYRQWKTVHPSPPPPPTVLFGSLPKTKFKEMGKKPADLYLETINNRLPAMPSQARVYFIRSKRSKILAYDLAKNLANLLGFTNEPEKIKEDLFLYKNSSAGTTLTINPITQNLKYKYGYENDQTIINQPISQNPQEINQKAVDFLKEINGDKPDIKQTGKISLYKLSATNMAKADSLSSANIARVDFFRKNIGPNGEMPVVPPLSDDPNISIWVSGNKGSHSIVRAKFIYFEIDQEKYSTYPLMPISQAWKEVKSGQYHLAQIDEKNANEKIAVRKIYLAYLDPDYPTEFLKPIYVFEGDHNFIGYKEAVSPDFLSN